MRDWAILAPLAAIVGTASYHLVQKQIPTQANPALSLLIAYLIGAVFCGICIITIFPIQGAIAGQIHWSAIALGVAIILIEGGFLFLYRSGWPVSISALVINIIATIVLVAVGMLAFGERPTLIQIGGALICLVGLAMMQIKSGS